MQLRPRQVQFVDRVTGALMDERNALGVAPTGFGKSVVMAAVSDRMLEEDAGKIVVLQHREELVKQNRTRLYEWNKRIKASRFVSGERNWRGDVVFAMVQTLVNHADGMPDEIAGVLIDEAHHAPAPSYTAIIDAVKERNENAWVCGVTATPERSDGKGYKGIFTNVADQVEIAELIRAGNLVKPRTYVVDIGVQQELKQVRRTASDYDMHEVERIMDHQILNDKIIEKWQELAGDRRTVVFCSTVDHAQHVAETFRASGVAAGVVYGDMPSAERKRVLADLDAGNVQVVCNVMVLTEGFDSPPVSCVVLLRPSSHKSVMTQMIGRGLRTVSPEKYPGIHKSDCIVMDFGTSVLQHGSLEQDVSLLGKRKPNDGSSAPQKNCPNCKSKVPLSVRHCQICGHEFKVDVANEPIPILEDFNLSEIELIEASPFRWEHLFDGLVSVCASINAWAVVVTYRGETHAFGAHEDGETGKRKVDYLTRGDRMICLAAADDHMREHGDRAAARKSKKWLQQPATDNQMKALQLNPMTTYGLTRYRASCMLTWRYAERFIRGKLEAM